MTAVAGRIGLVALVVALAGCVNQTSTADDLAQCEFEGMKALASQRSPHPVTGVPWPTHVEFEFRISCMRARGYVTDFEKVRKDGFEVDAWPGGAFYQQPKYWKKPLRNPFTGEPIKF